MKEYINIILLTYIKEKRRHLNLTDNYLALALIDDLRLKLAYPVFSTAVHQVGSHHLLMGLKTKVTAFETCPCTKLFEVLKMLHFKRPLCVHA